MKKDLQNNRLAFRKAVVTELNESDLNSINGNSFSLPASSLKCLTGALADHFAGL